MVGLYLLDGHDGVKPGDLRGLSQSQLFYDSMKTPLLKLQIYPAPLTPKKRKSYVFFAQAASVTMWDNSFPPSH